METTLLKHSVLEYATKTVYKIRVANVINQNIITYNTFYNYIYLKNDQKYI